MAGARNQRTVFLVDGFNLYHSIEEAAREAPDSTIKWLDLPKLLKAQLPNIGKKAVFKEIHYFTAFAGHLLKDDPEKVSRHKAYVRALTASKVKAHLGKFKRKQAYCPTCKEYIKVYEEKETDVAIASLLLKLAFKEDLDIAVLVTGDTDLAPAVRDFQNLFPQKRVLFAFPYKRKNKELAKLAPGSFVLGKETYTKYQFPKEVRLPSGKKVKKPDKW